MPRIARGYLTASQVATSAGIGAGAVRSLIEAGILPDPARLNLTDVLIARLCRHLWWTGPSVSRPGQDDEREQLRQRASRAAKHLRAAHAKGQITSTTRLIVTSDQTVLVERASELLNLWETSSDDRYDFAIGQWLTDARRELGERQLGAA